MGLGVDSIVNIQVTWPDGEVTSVEQTSADQVLVIKKGQEATAAEEDVESGSFFVRSDRIPNTKVEEVEFIDYNHEPLLLHKLSQYGPGISVGDVNDDGRDDYYISGPSESSG